MLSKIKAFFAWVYEWVTIIAAFVVAAISSVVEQIDQLTGLNLDAVFGDAKAATIIFYIALVKVAFVAVGKIKEKIAGA